jgi:hypothetical protein
VAGQRYELGQGECAMFPGDLHHGYVNEGTRQAVLTMVVVVPPAAG